MRPPGNGTHPAAQTRVSVLLVSHSFNQISFQPGQDTKQRRSIHRSVPEQDIFSNPQKCIFPQSENNQMKVRLVYYASLCCAVNGYDKLFYIYQACLPGKSDKRNIYLESSASKPPMMNEQRAESFPDVTFVAQHLQSNWKWVVFVISITPQYLFSSFLFLLY